MKNVNFRKTKTIYFIGIGGIGISAVARMFLLEGKKVSGSDVAEGEVTEGLQKVGAKIFIGQRAENVPAKCDLVIYTIAVPPDNPEFAEAKRRGISMMSYPEALGEISRDKFTIAVSGTHGKTTTTAMIAKILVDAELDPTVIVGSFINLCTKSVDIRCPQNCRHQMSTERTNFISGRGKYFVVEACEYRRSFLHLSPRVLVLTNIDADHLDYYKDMNDIISAFNELATKVPKSGFVVTDAKNRNIKLALKNVKSKISDYKQQTTSYRLKIPGQHNILNAQAALAVSKILGIEEKSAIRSLENFSGTWRRFEYRGKAKNGALVYDDYGHHPTEIEATLAGARELFPKQKIVVVFQPHLYSRTKDHLKAFGKCFKDANEVILLPIYPAREKNPGNINSEMVVAEIKKNNQPTFFAKDFADAASRAVSLTKAGDLILTLGAGETNKVADMLV
ncbi:MAG: UDP-N-acetylmuramate-L-alanine ligase [Parcubacteria group bacterium GW2011_GWB1_44_7]|nr:MAG: UDP-N-acetylmuramate-L-alanine ligase [Parcubacteria group bacterium GW2011_GWB1_44_7]